MPTLGNGRYYWVETADGHRSPMEHTVITSGTTPLPDADTAEPPR
ncbi:hypothetical protein BJY18_000433 [Amycolatopsis jiangsuensis]|uniref:Uncharacterized protein n=1 Tax=Amycolatopsis jiangsuensis TaxID=1181879 RepID=A0A840IP20_9PSEU|nr:hypothetical protein [Amycolatopsis jiangsuensis]